MTDRVHPGRVLVVDDEAFMRKVLVRQLENLGFVDVVACDSGRVALRLVEDRTQPVGLIFCDLQMPEMDGVEFVRHLVRIDYPGHLVLVSGEDERILQTAERLAQAHHLRVLAALHKPFSAEQLQTLVRTDHARVVIPATPTQKTYGPLEIRRAIECGELENYYQPKIEVATGRVCGVEALVRWRHPVDGLVFPDRFIPTVEEHRLIDDLTRSVLATALRDGSRWRNAGIDLHVAVNVSMENLRELSFPDFVARQLEVAGLPVSSLVLEVTESRLQTNPLASMDILTRLRLKYVRLSIDDFGTGHSSLAQLRDLPFEELKIDRSFVHGASADAALMAIVDGSVRMARQLGMKSVAEGVEDQADWDYLRAIGCDLAQGHFIERALPAADLADWLVRWEHRRGELSASA